MSAPENVTIAELMQQQRDNETHVCGNCRNPYTRYGRPDCPRNTRRTT